MGWKLMASNGEVSPVSKTMTFMVDSESDLLTEPPYDVEPGSVAYTAGMDNIWQLSASGEWARVAKMATIDTSGTIEIANVLPIINGYQ